MKPVIVSCPTCRKPVQWVPEQAWRPFCSERCRLIDLGAWVDELHHIPGDTVEDWRPPESVPEDD